MSAGGGLLDFSAIHALLETDESLRRKLLGGGGGSNPPRSIGTYDTETDGFHNCQDLTCSKCGGKGRIPQPFLHGLYDGENYQEFETIQDVIAFVEQKRMIWFAHNGGKFDYHPLRPYMNTDQPVMLIAGRLAQFHIGESEFRDSLNIFPNTRLADFGVKNEIDYALMEPGVRDDPNIRSQISSYMRQDCVGLYEQVARYRRDYGKNLTQAGASMRYWEKHHFEAKAPRQTKRQFDRCKPFYYGGRVQCFESGVRDTSFKVADVNSAYPYAMMHKHPISPVPSESKHLPRSEEHIQTAMIRLKCTARGCFPWRGENGELYFPEDDPIGSAPRMREYWITGWEFLAALECDAVTNIQIREVLTFAQTVSFEDYIDHHYQARLAAGLSGDKAGRIFGKYFMNSLYGKFGADPSNYAEYVIASVDSIEAWRARGYQEYQDWGDGKWLMERPPSEEELQDIEGRWRYYNVATAGSITGFERAYLFKAMHKASGLIYCDTDGIAARDLSNLQYGKALGLWKDEGTFQRYAIAGKKTYAFQREGREEPYDPTLDEKDRSWKVASKGVAFHAMADGPEKIIALANGQSVNHIPQVPTYSVSRTHPVFINRSIRSTAKDIRFAPL